MEPRAKELKMRVHALTPPARNRAAALVLVLGFLVLLSAMLVAFFATTTNSRRETAHHEAGVSVKQLADTATNIVIGQITDATKSWEIPAANPSSKGGGARLTFATQPGMIRTYDDKGRPWRAFKLYSSATMVSGIGTDWNAASELANEVPTDWPGKPALYTDINAPVLRPNPSGTIRLGSGEQKYSAVFPILDPMALSPTGAPSSSGTQDGVEGFNLLNVPAYGGPLRSGRPLVVPGYNPMAPTPFA